MKNFKYITKPKLIEAFQVSDWFHGMFTDDFNDFNRGDLALDEFLFNINVDMPPWLVKAIKDRRLYADCLDLMIKTILGPYKVSVNDFIVKDSKGYLYVVKPDVFKKGYKKRR